MSIVDSAVARILPPLSAILRKPLSIVAEGAAPREHPSVVTIGESEPLSIHAADGQPFEASERSFLHEVFGLVRTAEQSDLRYRELEERVRYLQQQNIELMLKNRVLSEVSSRDALTGLYNRWYLMEKIEIEMNRSLRHGSPVSVLMLDIDHFKQVNDSYGHSVGDDVLRAVGQVLRDSCRVYDVPGRYGGEEFCIVLPETKSGNTTVVAERIRQRLAATTLRVGDAPVGVTASIGIAGLDMPDDGTLTGPSLIERADRALYSAKHRGRDRVELWSAAMVTRAEVTEH